MKQECLEWNFNLYRRHWRAIEDFGTCEKHEWVTSNSNLNSDCLDDAYSGFSFPYFQYYPQARLCKHYQIHELEKLKTAMGNEALRVH
jgi:hypothetical protein